MNWNGSIRAAALLVFSVAAAQASVTLLMEEPYGTFGGMNPTGHAAIYLSKVCAASPTSLRRCDAGDRGVVISRYHRVAGYDWLAIPLLPYLYAVDQPDQVPSSVNVEDVAALRDAWRRKNLTEIVPDGEGGAMPTGDWTQLVGSAYDRTLYAFEIQTTTAQDERFIQLLNSGTNNRDFNLLFRNCADFARQAIDFYFPHAVHRSLIADVGIMTPKQAALSLLSYSKRHDVPVSVFMIPQVPGAVPRSFAVRVCWNRQSKRYAVPLVTVAALHPLFGGSLAFAWVEGKRFDPRRLTEGGEATRDPAIIATELQSDRLWPEPKSCCLSEATR